MTDSPHNKPSRPARKAPPPAPVSPAPAGRSHRPPAAVAPPRPQHRRTYHPEARLSRLAVMGAVWASLFFLMLLLLWVRSGAPLLPEIRPPLWHALLDYIIQPLGWSAPIAATVLGLLAISQIQRSEGQQYGLSLALFDALLFPLLVVDVLIVWLWRQLAAALILQDILSPQIISDYGSAVPVVIIILGDYYLATRAWEAVQSDEEEPPPRPTS